MGSFGNYIGATMGGEYDDSWVTNSNYPERQALLDRKDADGDGDRNELVDLEYSSDHDKNPYKPKSDLLGEVPNLTSDHTTNQEIDDALHGPERWNWERRTFAQLRDEKNALKPASLEELSTAWKEHGDRLKTDSEAFKKTVGNAISGKWSGASADAAEAASQQVTKTSIYDFTPSSEALSNRLKALKGAFDSIQSGFPDTADAQLIDDGKFDRQLLEQRIREFNSRYHLDGGGRLRNNSDGYVAASQAIDEMNRINRSIQDYQRAVQLFRDTYNPTVQAVTANFPNLPTPPNLKYGPTGPGPSGGGGTGGGGGGTGGAGGGGTGGGGSKFGTPPIGTSNFKTPDTGKNKAFSDYQLGTGDSKDPGKTPIDPTQTSLPSTDPTQTPAQSLKSGLDAATQGLNSGLGAATQAAQQAAQAAQGAAGAAQKPISPSLREGALGLGDKPGAAKGAGGSGVGGGGAGGREPLARPSSQPAASASAGARPSVPAAASSAAAGMGSGMGAPGAGGGPAAGQRGGEAKEHKGNKALRTRKNGSDIVGDTDAVVPVLGGDSPPPADDNQQAPPRRRIPGRNTSWQPDSAVQGGAQRPAQDPGAATPDQLMNQ